MFQPPSLLILLLEINVLQHGKTVTELVLNFNLVINRGRRDTKLVTRVLDRSVGGLLDGLKEEEKMNKKEGRGERGGERGERGKGGKGGKGGKRRKGGKEKRVTSVRTDLIDSS